MRGVIAEDAQAKGVAIRAEKRQQFGNQAEAVTGKREDKTHMKMITNQEINTFYIIYIKYIFLYL